MHNTERRSSFTHSIRWRAHQCGIPLSDQRRSLGSDITRLGMRTGETELLCTVTAAYKMHTNARTQARKPAHMHAHTKRQEILTRNRRNHHAIAQAWTHTRTEGTHMHMLTSCLIPHSFPSRATVRHDKDTHTSTNAHTHTSMHARTYAYLLSVEIHTGLPHQPLQFMTAQQLRVVYPPRALLYNPTRPNHFLEKVSSHGAQRTVRIALHRPPAKEGTEALDELAATFCRDIGVDHSPVLQDLPIKSLLILRAGSGEEVASRTGPSR